MEWKMQQRIDGKKKGAHEQRSRESLEC
jgi:hypothetical protein